MLSSHCVACAGSGGGTSPLQEPSSNSWGLNPHDQIDPQTPLPNAIIFLSSHIRILEGYKHSIYSNMSTYIFFFFYLTSIYLLGAPYIPGVPHANQQIYKASALTKLIFKVTFRWISRVRKQKCGQECILSTSPASSKGVASRQVQG